MHTEQQRQHSTTCIESHSGACASRKSQRENKRSARSTEENKRGKKKTSSTSPVQMPKSTCSARTAAFEFF